ncbi:MAG: DUF4252 domain-containing protein [Aureispira sp.]|nr:DUF4252 domain-containing protein [Aureispira sp.]
MRTLISIWITLLGLSITAFGQQDFIDKEMGNYAKHKDFTHLSLSLGSNMLDGLLKKADLGDSEYKELVGMIEGLGSMHLLITEKDTKKYYKEVMGKVDQKKYKVLMMVKDKGDNVRVWSRTKKDKIEEILLLVGGEDDFVLLSFSAN